jgi:GTP-binding protein
LHLWECSTEFVVKDSHSFVDEANVTVISGSGGDGMASFRREKFNPKGGPNGGDGGRGGDVVLVADRNLNTLTDLRYRQRIKADAGARGGSSGRTGASGETREVLVPLGTVVYAGPEQEEGEEPLGDLSEPGQRLVVARGGKGGLGNMRFKTPTRQAPDFATEGRSGESHELRLSLKLLADVGFVGFPNAGKSTLLRRVSAARPRVASYPFTTLVPSLGVVEQDDRRFVVADIPGLIEGASEGIGLGDRFLRHIERTRVIVHLLDLGAKLFEERDLLADYETLRRELGKYNPELLERRELLVLNKVDLVADPLEVAAVVESLTGLGHRVHCLSGATGEGSSELIHAMLGALDEAQAEADALEPQSET